MLYLAHIKLLTSNYGSTKKSSENFHIVEAESKDDVETKVKKHYEDKSTPYYITYEVMEYININEVIT